MLDVVDIIAVDILKDFAKMGGERWACTLKSRDVVHELRIAELDVVDYGAVVSVGAHNTIVRKVDVAVFEHAELFTKECLDLFVGQPIS